MIRIEADYQCPKSEKRKGVCRVIVRSEGKSRIVPTGVKVYRYEWDEVTRSIRTENASASRLKELLKGQQELAGETSMLEEIVNHLQAEQGGCTLSQVMRERDRWLLKRSFFTLVESRIAHFRESGQESTASNYRCALCCFQEFRKERDLALTELTASLMKEFQKYLQRKGLSMNTISLYNRNLRAAYNYALDEELLREDRRPFRKVFTGVEKTRKRAVREDVVRRLIALDLSDDPSLDFARDIFLFSIYTQGMAFVDVAHLTTAHLHGGVLTYKRRKTGQPLTLEVPPCAQAILHKYYDPEERTSYLLPLLYHAGNRNGIKYGTVLREYNRRLRLISERLRLKTPLSSYVARHTWASIAKWNGVEESVISEAMGHSNMDTTTIYLASLDTEVIGSANRTVVSRLFEQQT